MKRSLTFFAVAALAGTGVAATVLTLANSVFLGAPAGVPVHFAPVALPAVSITPAQLALQHFPPTRFDPFHPSLQKIVHGTTVVTNEAQMKALWGELFTDPFDAGKFDFTNDFVILMGSGELSLGSFGIGSVEIVNAQYPSFGFTFPGSGTDTDPFLSVTTTTFFPGVQPSEPPPPSFYMSAVRVSRDFLLEVVSHRSYIYGV
ncbi:MAG: hypothetical protein HY286_05510 [Planctomycetes bacterium]|nr:hypothetical protein [Planctomycetota bacterium]